jgi:branched-chain amino acid transport system ATP-binding protein
MNTILQVKNITQKFGGLVSINSVLFEVNKGEIFGLIGPNGAGKTTLFNIITGLINPTHGNLIFNQENITPLLPFQIAKKGIARTFQNLRLFGNLSVIENVIIAHHIHNQTNLFSGIFGLSNAKKSEKEMIKKSKELLELLGLQDVAKQQANNLAYGDQRRLEIARALALQPQLLLLDEPAAGMNPQEKHLLSELIRKIRDQFNLTVLLIEHHIPLVMGLCDRIAVLDFGQLIALGEPEKVRNDPAVIEAYLGDN